MVDARIARRLSGRVLIFCTIPANWEVIVEHGRRVPATPTESPMQTRIFSALIAMVMASSSACAQEAPPPVPPPAPMTGMVPPDASMPVPLAGALPPLPPGCITAAPPAPQPPMMAVTDVAFETALGLSSAQAARVRQVFEQQAAQTQRLDQQRRDVDASTCRNLRDIVGDQGLARWWSVMPPPRGRRAPPPPMGPNVPPGSPPPPMGVAPPPPLPGG